MISNCACPLFTLFSPSHCEAGFKTSVTEGGLQKSRDTEMDPVTFHHREIRLPSRGVPMCHQTPGTNPAFISPREKSLFLFERLVWYHPPYIWAVDRQLMTEPHHVSRVKRKPFEDCRTAII